MQIDSTLFADVADALGLGNPAIVEKDFYVVQLLKCIEELSFDTHTLVFSGGTALSKSGIKIYRMSEDVDIKLVPKDYFHKLPSNNLKRKARKKLRDEILHLITADEQFEVESNHQIEDEYRHQSFEIRYPQQFVQAPCLRPYIKLEFTESHIFDEIEYRGISSLTNEALKQPGEVQRFPCVSVISTQAEKLISMLRRTASYSRNTKRNDDPTLIRHIYDTFHIQTSNKASISKLEEIVAKTIKDDLERYGNQHPEFVKNSKRELLHGLKLLLEDPMHQKRFEDYVTPMVYGPEKVEWKEAVGVFKKLATTLLK